MYRGKRYTIACAALDAPATQEESRDRANQWWITKRAEIDAAGKPPRVSLPMEDLAAASAGISPDNFADVRSLLESMLEAQEATRAANPPACNDDGYKEDIPIPEHSGDDAGIVESIRQEEVMGLLRKLLFGSSAALPDDVAARLPPARVHEVESAIVGLRGERPAPPDRTVKARIGAWLASQEKMVAIGEMTAARFGNVKIQMAHVAAYLGEKADASKIDAASIQGFYDLTHGKMVARRAGEKGWSAPYARESFATFRRWVRWVAEQGVIPLPPNIASRSFRFGSTVKAVPTWTTEEVRRVLNEASDRMRLFLLLMLNTGATQQDISDLLDTEVDWTAGRIVRKRSKTGDKESTPVVNYLLWPATFALLRQYRSGKANVLLTETGRTLLRQELCGGNLVRADLIASNYSALQRRIGFKKPLKYLRKTAATMLESHETYGRMTSLFLGHAPRSMADRHYAAPSPVLFDEAILWLGSQLGLA